MNENEYKLEINVTKDNVTITNKEKIHNGEYKIVECVFTFSEDFDGLTKKAIFEAQDALIEMPITNNKCNIPVEILSNDYFQCNLRVYGYETEEVNGETSFKLRYSPTYDTFPVYKGSYIPDAQGTQEITPTQFEQYSEALNEGLEEVNAKLTEMDNLDISASKVGNTATVTVTKKDGTEQTVQIFDGEQGIQGPEGPVGPAGADGKDGKDGKDGTNGRDGAIQYTAGANITIENNVISATGGGSGGIPVITGTEDDPVDFSTLDAGTYFINGYYTFANLPSTSSNFHEPILVYIIEHQYGQILFKGICVYEEINPYETIYKRENNVWEDYAEYYIANSNDLEYKEDKSNKVTSLSNASTDTQYPSAKCVYDLIGNIETLLEEI